MKNQPHISLWSLQDPHLSPSHSQHSQLHNHYLLWDHQDQLITPFISVYFNHLKKSRNSKSWDSNLHTTLHILLLTLFPTHHNLLSLFYSVYWNLQFITRKILYILNLFWTFLLPSWSRNASSHEDNASQKVLSSSNCFLSCIFQILEVG